MKIIFYASVLLILAAPCFAQNTEIEKPGYGSNIATVVPMQIMNNNTDYNSNYHDNSNGTDVAIGFAYERILANEYIGIKLPFSFSLKNPGFFYVMPAIKLYPKKQGVVKYAVGPQFLIAIGTIKYSGYYYDPYAYTSIDTSFTENSTQLGFMINNSLNVTVAKQFYIGMEIGIGIQYFDSRDNNDNSKDNYNNTPFEPNIQLNFNMGYRF